MTENNQKENLKHALCYVPFLAIVLAIIEKNKTPELKKHINHWILLLVWIIVVKIVLSMFGYMFGLWWLWQMAVLLYILISAGLWYKAYIWEDVELDALEDIEEKINEKLSKNSEQK